MIHQWKSLFFTALKVVTLPFYEVLDGKVPFFKTAGIGSPVQNAVRKLRLYIPSGELTKQWKITMFNGKIHYKWPFSIAMLVYQRVTEKINGKHDDNMMTTENLYLSFSVVL